MLSTADRAICDRDPALPGLPLLLDAPEFGRMIGCHELAPAYLRYKPGTSCAAAFMHPEQGPIAAFAYTPERYREVLRRDEWRGEPDVVMLDAACIAVIPARLDRDLKSLRRFCDAARREKFLRRLIGRRSGIWKGEIEILRYKPGRRLVACITAKGRPRAALKITAATDFNQALIGAAGAAAHEGARLLGCDAGRCALVTEWIDGDPLCPEALGRAPDMDAVARTGAALARLHAAAFRPAAATTRADELAALDEVAPAMTALHTELGRKAGRIAGALADRLQTTDHETTLIHGDFSADQVMLSGGRPVILDWDHAATGDPASDFGTFLARLDAQVADSVLAPQTAEAMGTALMDGYARSAGWLPEGIAVQHARGLLMLATEGFRIRHPDWPERTGTLLDRAAGLLAPRRRRVDPALPELDDALDPAKAGPALAAAMGHAARDVRMTEPRLLRHKPGRRALVRYDMIDAEGNRRAVLGKLRSKGLDRRMPALHDALRAAGLDGSGGVGVPRAVGAIPHLGLWLQELVPGVGLGEGLAPDADPAPFARTGAALAALHRVGPADTRRWTMADELAVLSRALDEAGKARPDLAPAMRVISQNAAEQVAAIGEGPVCGIHRDFYFDQVIVEGDRIWIVDLDLYACGDPAIDVGNFLAHLDELGLRHHADPHAFDRQKAAFREGYGAASGPADPERVAVLQAVSLARHVHLGMRLPGRSHTVEPILGHAATELGAKEKCQP
ncbi:phosphotransferase [Roseovarius tibetensis]|uniref:phosphotransferase n=1 Tax=Roseovarius tibetensis TaxID=2685897 RepID=UPI003D7FC1DA